MVNSLNLDGPSGIIYLMYLGRESYAAEWTDKLVGENRFVSHKSSVYQAVSRLEKRNYIRRVRTDKNKTGAPVIRTANFKPLFKSLEDINLKQEQRNRLKNFISDLSPAVDFFPEYLHKYTQTFDIGIKKLIWFTTLPVYFSFLIQTLTATCINFEPSLFEEATKELSLPGKKLDLDIAMKASNTFTDEKTNRICEKYNTKDVYFLISLTSYLSFGEYGEMMMQIIGKAMSKTMEELENQKNTDH